MKRPLTQFVPLGITALGFANAAAASARQDTIALGPSLAMAVCGILLGAADSYETSLQRDAAAVAHLVKNPGARTRHRQCPRHP